MSQYLNVTNLKKTYYYLKRNGIKNTVGAALERVQARYYADYTYVCPTEEQLNYQRNTVWKDFVTFSIVVPAYETKPQFLHQLIESLQAQTYPKWELILVDASSTNQVKQELKKYQDDRIWYLPLESNDGISENTNAGIQAAIGDYIGLLDHDDYLTPDALYEMAKAIQEAKEQNKEYGFLYSDEDKCDETGTKFYEPHFKLPFNLDLFLSNNYICHFLVMKRELMQQLALRKEYDGAQDYDLCLRAVARLWNENPKVEQTICHIPKVLYHWRCHNDSTAANPQSKQYAYEAGRRALKDFTEKRGWKAEVEHMSHLGFYKINYKDGVFSQRDDIVAIGKKLLKHGKITGGIYNEAGKPLYEGLPVYYSGYLHRAVLPQNACQLDIDTWEINPKYYDMIETFKHEIESKESMDKKKIQKELCEKIRTQGYRLYWNPIIYRHR